MSRRVCFSPETRIYAKDDNVGENKKRVMMRIWIFKLPKGSRNFFKNIGEKVAKTLPAAASRRRCSRKVSSASLGRSRSYAETQLDSQRAEAIEDCIEFLNSSSLLRSNSVSTSC